MRKNKDKPKLFWADLNDVLGRFKNTNTVIQLQNDNGTEIPLKETCEV